MAMKARLFVDGEYYNLKSFQYGFRTGSNANGFSSGKTKQTGLTCVIEAIRQEYFEEWAFEDHMKKYVEIHMEHTVQGHGKTRVLKCHDTFLLEFHTHFSSTSEEPMTFELYMKSGVIEASWSTAAHIEKWSSLPEEGEVTVLEVVTPQITSLKWVNSETQEEDITEIGYNESASLIAFIENDQGGSATIIIEKEDGSEFENGKTQLSFTESIQDGMVELTPIEIKEQWEGFKTSDIDKLVAKISHGEVAKTSKPLLITPKPYVIANFRPHAGWAGEFGFDWMRTKDTLLDGDTDYRTKVGKYGAVYATNKGKAVFTDGNFTNLEAEYKPNKLNERKDLTGKLIKYYTPWLSIYRDVDDTANPPIGQLELLIDVTVSPDELYVEFPKKHFEVIGATNSTSDAELMQYKLPNTALTVTTKGKSHNVAINFYCIHTLSKDETIKVWAVKKKRDGTLDTPILSGLLNVKANSKIHRRVSKIVFVNVMTNINSDINFVPGIVAAKKIVQENYLTPFLKQALIKPMVVNVDLKLFDTTKTNTQILNTDYTLVNPKTGVNGFNKYSNGGGVNGVSLVNFLKQQFNALPANSKYADYYKVFYLGENGGYMKNADYIGLGGHANGINSKECVMYKKPLPFFIAHELMHCMGLYHSFDNDGRYTFEIGQTENLMDYSHLTKYANPTLTQKSTWKWQWKVLKEKNEKEI